MCFINVNYFLQFTGPGGTCQNSKAHLIWARYRGTGKQSLVPLALKVSECSQKGLTDRRNILCINDYIYSTVGADQYMYGIYFMGSATPHS